MGGYRMESKVELNFKEKAAGNLAVSIKAHI